MKTTTRIPLRTRRAADLTKVLVLIIALNCSWQCMAVPNTWTQKTNFGGVSRHGAVGFGIGNKGYIGTGYDSTSYKNDFWEYDQSTDTWAQKANFGGSARNWAVGFSIGSKGYIGTGGLGFFSPTQDFWEYDPGTNIWTQKANYGGGIRLGATGFSILGKGYICSGSNGNNQQDLWEYDPIPNTWIQKANYPGVAGAFSTGFSIGAKGYMGTGGFGPSTLFFEYDPSTDVWTAKASVGGVAREWAVGFSVGNKGYIGCGYDQTNYLQDFWEYDPIADTWTAKANLGGPVRYSAVGFRIGNKGYIGTGANASNYLRDFWEYDAGCALPVIFSAYAVSNPSCTGLPVYLYVQAGLGSFTYSWTGPAAITNATSFAAQVPVGAVSGTYNIVVTNACGSSNANVALVVNNPPTLSAVITGVSCPGQTDGAIDLTVTGGGGPITYDWTVAGGCATNSNCPLAFPTCQFGVCHAPSMQDLANLPMGTYNVQVIAGGCYVNATYTVGTTSPDSDGDGLVDCLDNCPLVVGQIGSPCNDNNPNTINDVLNGSCVCIGTPICAGIQVTLTLNTDANPAQTTWDIVNDSTNVISCSGGIYTPNTTVTVPCCLTPGRYNLRVYDSFGDGISPGGYVLRDPANFRIIDNFGNGPNFTVLSEVLDATSTPVPFRVPIGTDALTPLTCDQTGLTIKSVVQCTINANVSAQYGISNATSGYQFWVFDPNTGYSRRLFQSHAAPGTGWPLLTPVAQRAAYFKLSAMNSVPTILSNTLLNMRVRSRVANVYGEFGPACRLTIGTVINCSTTQLTTTPTPVVSCGATLLNRLFGVLWSNNVTGANKYQFEFINANTLVFLRNISSPTRNLNMNTWGGMIALPNCFTPYNIRVRVSFNGGATWCPWGPVCQVSFTCPPEQGREMVASSSSDVLHVWPNPNNGDQIFITIGDLGEEVSTASIEVIDVFGKRVMSELVSVDGNALNTVLDLKKRLSDGLYVVNITAGDRTFTQRLVIVQ